MMSTTLPDEAAKLSDAGSADLADQEEEQPSGQLSLPVSHLPGGLPRFSKGDWVLLRNPEPGQCDLLAVVTSVLDGPLKYGNLDIPGGSVGISLSDSSQTLWIRPEHMDTMLKKAEDPQPAQDGQPICPQGHTLVAYTVTLPGTGCDGCRVAQPLGNQARGCRTCNWDLCQACFDQKAASAGAAAASSGEVSAAISWSSQGKASHLSSFKAKLRIKSGRRDAGVGCNGSGNGRRGFGKAVRESPSSDKKGSPSEVLRSHHAAPSKRKKAMGWLSRALGLPSATAQGHQNDEPEEEDSGEEENSGEDSGEEPVGGGGNAGPVDGGLDLARGCRVDVWSSSLEAWETNAVVADVLETAKRVDGQLLPAGSVMISFRHGTATKWIAPADIKEELRRAQHEDEAAERDSVVVAAPDGSVGAAAPASPEYAVGDEVMSWSNASKTWEKAVVIDVLKNAVNTGGFSLPEGSVTVLIRGSTEQRTIMPDLFAGMLRRADAGIDICSGGKEAEDADDSPPKLTGDSTELPTPDTVATAQPVPADTAPPTSPEASSDADDPTPAPNTVTPPTVPDAPADASPTLASPAPVPTPDSPAVLADVKEDSSPHTASTASTPDGGPALTASSPDASPAAGSPASAPDGQAAAAGPAPTPADAPAAPPCYSRQDQRVLVIGPGFGRELNPAQGAMLEAAGFQIRWVFDLPNPETPMFPALQFLPTIKRAIDEFQPHIVACASKGGAYLTALWFSGLWAGPSLIINRHPTLLKIPKGITAVVCHGSNDEYYQFRRQDLEDLLRTGSENRCLLYYTANSGLLGRGYTREGDRHNMQSILQYDCLPRLIDAALAKDGPEMHLMSTWDEMLTKERLAAEEWLGYSTMCLRRFWDSEDQKGMDDQILFQVPDDSEEYRNIAAVFRANPRVPRAYHDMNPDMWQQIHIVKIERVENGMQEDGCAEPYYNALQRGIENQGLRFRPGLHTRWAFHGSQDVESIISDPISGFQPLMAGSRAYNLWGSGTYFARDAKYAYDGGFCKTAADGSRQVMMCLCMIGMPCLGDPQHKGILPMRQGRHRYNSSVDCLSNPEIFVLQSSGAAYPAYVITFA